ncbi:MAG: type IV secretion system DNA-binding domain-containing protein [Pseudomonadota bacterium]
MLTFLDDLPKPILAVLSLVVIMAYLMIPDVVNFIHYRITPKKRIRDLGLGSWLGRRAVQGFIGLLIMLVAIELAKQFGVSIKKGDGREGWIGLSGYFVFLLIWEWIQKLYRSFRWGHHTETLRGAVIADDAECKRMRKAIKQASPDTIFFSHLPVSLAAETKHFKIIGTTGTGKSSVIRLMIKKALWRQDRAIIADPDGGYLSRFYQPERGDIILNPFDARSHSWALMDEIHSPHDVRLIAESLIPQVHADDEWKSYARLFIASLLTYCKQEKKNLNDFLYLAVAAPQDELYDILKKTPAAPYTDPANSRMFGSVRSIASTHLASLEYLQSGSTESFSIREWVKNGKGCLFLPYRSDQIAALRELISTWMQLAIFETLRLEEKDNRLWFFVDELDALGQIGGMKDALARVRKYGGRMVLGFQSISQVRATYGSEADTIVENCANTLILRCSASENGGTSRFTSELIGQQEKSFLTYSLDKEGNRSQQQQITTDYVVLPSEIEQFADRQGIMKLADRAQWFKVSNIDVVALPKVAEAFEEIKFGKNIPVVLDKY